MSGDIDAQLSHLADQVVHDEQGFDRVWDRFRIAKGLHLRRDAALQTHDPFELQAISAAHHAKALRALAGELVKEQLVKPPFLGLLDQILGQGSSSMQSFHNGVFLPVDALKEGAGLLLSCEHVCRIEIDGVATGTGVLIRPNLVATATHVIWDLVEKDSNGDPSEREDGSLKAAADSLSRLTLRFGRTDDVLRDDPGEAALAADVALLHDDWLAWGSSRTQNERSTSLFDVMNIDGIDAQKGPWDVSILRLADKRRLVGETIRTDLLPNQQFQINILHHPVNALGEPEPLLRSIGQLDQQLGTPPVRVLHDASTSGGSSGAPIFDRNWRIVALHQGQRQATDTQSGHNRGIPVLPWHCHLDEVARRTQDTEYLRRLTVTADSGGPLRPVIGRHRTQDWVRAAMAPGSPAKDRLLIVRGNSGLGLRFTKRIVREMVEPTGNVVVSLDLTNALADDALGLVRKVVAAVNQQVQVPADLSGLTTTTRDLVTEVVPTLVQELRRVSQGRQTWLVLEGLEATSLEAIPTIKDLIVATAKQLPEYENLRLVLVGWQDQPPVGYELAVEELEPPTGYDLAVWALPPGSEPDGNAVTLFDMALSQASRAGQLSAYDAACQVVQEWADRRPGEGGAR